MDASGFTLLGLIVGTGILYIISLVFAVLEYKRWHISSGILILCAFLFFIPQIIWPIVSHAARRVGTNMDRNTARIKLALSWFLVVGMVVANGLSTYFCRQTVSVEFADELALCCSYAWLFVAMLFVPWINLKLNAAESR